MANSTAIGSDTQTLNTTAFSAATLTKAKDEGMDIIGMANAASLKAQELKTCLQAIAAGCDAGDGQLTLTNEILGTLA